MCIFIKKDPDYFPGVGVKYFTYLNQILIQH